MTAQRPGQSTDPAQSTEPPAEPAPQAQEPRGAGQPESASAPPADSGEPAGTEQPPDSGQAVAGQQAEDGPTAAEFEDRWRRTAADLENLRKRYHRDLSRERGAERDRVAGAFLPVVDNIDLALRHAEADPNSIIEGIRAVRDQALALLAGLGYPRQDEAGVPFDPTRHEVVGVVSPEDSGAPPGAVAAVVRPGYGAPERQLRPASVTVTRTPGD
ncbi:nucleotide exchange factor GrpE [Pseudonocardia sp.]|jgi:molecular chaperone GrpE|uniref:nucleotide exchange factor GrpE n=1 Tax=Pseudonocardia sp. TaxID=60912 RepID=UPI00262AB599|nr:nucleotide exchange factor GrpE [Pseudonocardia sp.]MCW2718765.1 molecular chaperone GrpE [Pseudonocardia sp.]MDT7617910.1 molecular chaperone GrpE [Pseudonocardiales bacterium]